MNKESFNKYYKFETHLHSNDTSLCSRTRISEWAGFYKLNLPWINLIALANHSNPPGSYQSSSYNKQPKLKEYGIIENTRIYYGLEINMLKEGFDVEESELGKIPWVLGSVHKLPREYPQDKGFPYDTPSFEKRMSAALETHCFDVWAHPFDHLPIEITEKLDWEKLISACRKHNILIEVNLLIDHPEWWLHALAKNKAFISFGSDWHGLYNFRFFEPLGISDEEKIVLTKVLENGRQSYDGLNKTEKEIYNNMYLTKKLQESFYKVTSIEIDRALGCGIEDKYILNTKKPEFFIKFLQTPRKLRVLT